MSSQGYFLHALHQALLDVLPAKYHHLFDSRMEDGGLLLEPKNMGPTGSNVAYLTYRAVYTLEGLPFHECDPAVLLATVAAWLQDNDPERERFELPNPKYSNDRADEYTADLEIQVTFVEPLRLCPDEKGPVLWGGQYWAVEPYEIWVVDQLHVQVAGSGATEVKGQL